MAAMAAPIQMVQGLDFFSCEQKITLMPTYRATYKDKLLINLEPAKGDGEPKGDTILENQTGELIFATIDAADEAEAQEKAKQISLQLQTGKTKRELGDNQS